MVFFSQQISSLLTSSPGNLVYHLLLAFSIMVPLVVSFNQWHELGNRQRRRMTIGLGALLIGRLLLFVLAILSLSGTIESHQVLPPIDRMVTTFSLIVVFWLLAFPDPAPKADVATVLTSILVGVSGIISIVIWRGQSPDIQFNSTGLETGWEAFSILLALAGIVLLFYKQPENWSYGIAFLLVSGIGHLASVFLSVPESDFAGLVRLSQIAVYPLLIFLPQGPLAPTSRESLSSESDATDEQSPAPQIEKDHLDQLLSLFEGKDFQAVLSATPRTVANIMVADICFLLTPPNDQGEMIVQFGFELIREKTFQGAMISAASIPAIAETMNNKLPLLIPEEIKSSEGKALCAAIGFMTICHLLIVPLDVPDSASCWGLVVASPFSNKKWTEEDQAYLMKIARVINLTLANTILREKLGDQKPAFEAIRTEAETSKRENQILLSEIAALREQIREKQSEAENIAPLLQANEEAKKKIALLEIEKQDLMEKIQSPSSVSGDNNLPYPERTEEDQSQIQQLLAENKTLQDEIDESTEIRGKLAARIQTLESAHEEALKIISTLQEENENLRIELENSMAGSNEEQPPPPQVEVELRNALREVARLQKMLGESDVLIFQLERQARNATKAKEHWGTIGSVAQELRQPMSSIVGYTDFLLGESVGILGSLQRKFLERVKASTERMNTMVEDLIQVAAMESGQLDLLLGAVDLNEVIDNTISEISSRLREKEIILNVDLPASLPPIQGDLEALQQVMIHLLENAWEASPEEGEIKVSARSEKVDEENDYILLQISDSGEGIRSEDLPIVFERHSIEETEPIKGIGTSNMGLAIAKTLTEAHGGRIWVDTELGEGSTFSVLIPLFQKYPPNIANWSN